jgi:hypothetical protein
VWELEDVKGNGVRVLWCGIARCERERCYTAAVQQMEGVKGNGVRLLWCGNWNV